MRPVKNWQAGSLVISAAAIVTSVFWPATTVAQPECRGMQVTVSGASKGDDTLIGTDSADVIAGGGGNDQIIGQGGDDLLCGNGGDDLVVGDAPFLPGEASNSPEGDDRLYGDGGVDHVEGLGGNDRLDGGAGDSDLAGYVLADGPVSANLTGGTASGADGTDALTNFENLSGSDFDDVLGGDEQFNVLRGGNGDDDLFGRGRPDTLDGGEGNDGLFGGESDVDFAIYFDATSAVNADLATGSATVGEDEDVLLEIEVVNGSRFDDRLRGDAGENVFIGGDGDDLIDGREAVDTVAYFASTAPGGGVNFESGPVDADLARGTAWNHADRSQSAGDALTSIEVLFGSDEDDVLRGDGGRNQFLGEGGDDTLSGRGGDDFFDGGRGDDRMLGGRGNGDFAYYFFGPRIRANLNQGTVHSGGDRDRVKAVDILAGSRKDDVLLGSRRKDFMLGAAGRDRLRGGAATDTLDGEAGRDRLAGGAGRDHCLDRPHKNCEVGSLPAKLQDERAQARAQLKRGIKLKKGVRRRGGRRRRR